MIRPTLTTTAIALTLAAAVPAPALAAGASSPASRGNPGAISGRTVLQCGALVHTDYLYDAWGPNLDGVGNPPAFPSAPASQTSGDYRYPDEPRYAGDGADLRELRLELGRKGLRGEVSLQTMADPAAAIATVAIDVDGDARSGSGAWPDGANLTTPGADLLVTVWGGGARLTDATGSVRSIPGGAKAAKDRFEFTIPRAALGELAARPRVWAGVGLATGDGRYAEVEPGATAVWDLAFQGRETFEGASAWGDQRQAAALAGADLTAFSTRFKPKSMRAGRSTSPRLAPGYYNAVFRSASDYGDGISTREPNPLGTSDPEFLGRHQPYGLYVPVGLRPGREAPLLLALHSLSRNHNQYVGTTPNLLEELGGRRGSIVITPLARGVDTWYLDSGLVDTLEAWDDVASGIAGLRVDPERTSLMGYSMGGYGTYRLGLLMPDRFARAATFVGPPAFAAWVPPYVALPEARWQASSLTNPLVPNALNLPYEINVGGSDTLVPQSGTKAQAASFAAAGNEYRFYLHPDANHYTFALDDVWDHTRKWLGNHRRVVNPRRVRYVRMPAFDLPGRGLVFDGAYWADGIEPRDGTLGTATVDVTAEALAEPSGAIVDEGTTELPAGAAGSTAATVTGQHLVPGGQPKLRNGFTATLTNVGSVELDARRMRLDLGRRLVAHLSGDGPTTLRLRVPRGAGPVRATLDGSAIVVRRRGRLLELPLPLGGEEPHRLTITPR